jgi:thymidylate synthase ThyX
MSERGPLTEPVSGDIHRLTDAGKEHIADLVTNVDGQVFAWTEKADKHMVATQNMRKSRSRNDGRVIYAKEFSGGEDRDLQVAFRVSQEFGDDSVQQLYSVDMDITGLSQLATKQVEWHRTGIAYLERSTRYVPYDEKLPEHIPLEAEVLAQPPTDYTEKDTFDEYRYVTPSTITGNDRLLFRALTDSLFDNYTRAVERTTDYVRQTTPRDPSVLEKVWLEATKAKALDAARALLPSSARTTVGFHATAQAVNHLVMRLRASDIPEAVELGDQVQTEARKLSPVFFERTDWPHRGGEHVRFYKDNREAVHKAAERYLPPKSAQKIGGQVVRLTNYYPEDEFALLPYMLYEEADSGYSLEDIRAEIDGLSHRQKLNILKAYMGNPTNRRHRPGRALERAVYDWDLVTDFGAFRDLQRHRAVSDLKWQRLTVAHGFDVPPLLQEVGLAPLCERSVRLSESLYETLQTHGHQPESQYAVLLGHRLRWTWQTNARANKHIFELRSQPAGHPSYRKTVQTMHKLASEAHPYLAKYSMPFMNWNEDAELGRLDQEIVLEHKRQLHRS